MTSYRKSHLRVTASGQQVRVRQSRVRDRKDEADVLEMIAALSTAERARLRIVKRHQPQ
jgi:hypothetical protein